MSDATTLGLVDESTRIFLAGHNGLVGGAILRRLRAEGFTNIITRSHAELDLMDQAATRRFFDEERPDAVIDAAAMVGGILANWELPWEFVERNLLIELNVIGEAYRHEVPRLIFLGSSCIYPREAPQPLREEYLLTGPLEETNRSYAIAKIAGIEMCRSLNREYGTDYLSVMPTNLYGPGDNFDLRSSHAFAAMIRKFHDGKVQRGTAPVTRSRTAAVTAAVTAPVTSGVTLWGTGAPRREFLHVDDMARAVTFCLRHVHAADVPDGLLNVGCGEDVTLRELAALIQRVVGYEGPVTWDDTQPDGTPRKLMDVSRIKALGWEPHISLEDGVRDTYEWFLANHA